MMYECIDCGLFLSGDIQVYKGMTLKVRPKYGVTPLRILNIFPYSTHIQYANKFFNISYKKQSADLFINKFQKSFKRIEYRLNWES